MIHKKYTLYSVDPQKGTMCHTLFVLFFLLLIVSCSKDTVINIRPDSGMTATIYEPGGMHPAKRAMVKFYEVSSTGLQPASIYLTDDFGRFSIRDLPGGIYRCFVEKNVTALFQDSVLVASSHSTLRDDTLEYTSTLSGTVSILPFHDPRCVTIRSPGTGKITTVSGVDGRFTLTGLAGGTYMLLAESELSGFTSCSREVTVSACSHDTICDTLHLFSTGIPAVSGIRFKQDTLHGTVTLSWEKSTYTNLLDYVIYKEKCSDVNVLKTAYHVTTDTEFVDNLGASFSDNQSDSGVLCLNYWIALRSNNHETGPAFHSVNVQAASKGFVTTFFTHNVVHANGTHDSASVNDTIICSLRAHNPTRSLRRLVWFNPSTGDTIAIIKTGNKPVKEISNSLSYSFPDTGVHYLQAIVTDNAFTEWRDTIPVTICMDLPKANAGNDTGVFTGEKVHLHGSAFQRFGRITSWQWKIGSDGNWNKTSGPDTVIIPHPPASETMVVCSLAVTDEDGNRSVDDVSVISSEKIRSISAGANHSLIQTVDSSVWSFGSNKYGQLGDGTSDDQEFPILLATGVHCMAAGGRHTLILRSGGVLLGCGYNRNGQLGDGSLESCTFLIQSALNVQHIAAGSFHSMILKTDGTLWTCGRNIYGQLGDSTLNDHSVPVKVMDNVQNMAAGLFHSLILKKDGSLWTCGCDSLGQLGDSAAVNRPWPLQIMTGVKTVAAGENHNLILKIDGSLWVCGDNYYGQLGDGTHINRPVPVQIMNEVKCIAAGASHSLILKNDGSLLSCGHNGYGQLGDGSTDFASSPKIIMTCVQNVSAGTYHSLILKTDGSLWVCGSNLYGQLGNSYLGIGGDRIQPTPKQAIPFRVYAIEEQLP